MLQRGEQGLQFGQMGAQPGFLLLDRLDDGGEAALEGEGRLWYWDQLKFFRIDVRHANNALALVLKELLCLWGVHGLKRMLNVDDSLDVFGVHGIGGILGAILTGVFASPDLGGTGVWDYVANAVAPDYSIAAQVKIQAIGVVTTIVWSGLVSIVGYFIIDKLVGLRVPVEAEREGLDLTSHGERAYNN